MNYLNSVFVVLLVILVAIGAFGFLINESLDQQQVIADQETEIANLLAQLSQQSTQCQNTIAEKDRQLAEIQARLDQALLDLQTAQQSLDGCTAVLAQTQQELEACLAAPVAPPVTGSRPSEFDLPAHSSQVETQAPLWAAMTSDNIVALVAGMGSVAVFVALILRVKVHKVPAVQQPAPLLPALHPNARQVTVKMNTQAYQGYLDYLKSSKK